MTVGSDVFLVVMCPLAGCLWLSEPLTTKEQAHQALRRHIDSHAHAALVEHVSANIESRTVRYDRRAEPVRE